MSDRPSIGGATGSQPVARTRSVYASGTTVPAGADSSPGASVTSTVPGAVIRPVPRITVTPARPSRRCAAESSRPPVTSFRRATASSQLLPRAAESSSEFDGRQAR